MLDSLLRIRLHLAVKKTCCNKFKSNEFMLNLFNSKMYVSDASQSTSKDIEGEELDETLTLMQLDDDDGVYDIVTI